MPVSILPELTEEQAEAVQKALDRRDEADYQCFLLLREAKQYIGNKPQDADEREELADLLERVEEVLNEREDANDDFLRALLKKQQA